MLAETFWASEAGLAVTLGLSFLALFSLGWLLFGTAVRVKHEREMAARMAAAGRAYRGAAPPQRGEATGGWIPERMTKFGERFASAGGFAEALDARLEAAGVAVRSGEFVVASVVGAFVGAVLGAALLRNVVLALVIGGVGGALPTLLLNTQLGRRSDKLREQLPDVLTILASSLRAGHSFLQALDTVSKEIGEPAATEFVRVVAEIRLGRPVDEALEAMADRVGSDDFRWAVLAVNIQREVGGNLAEILDNVADTLRERATMRRQIKVLTAEGRLSAYVLIALPFVIGLYMTAVNPDYIGLLVTTTIGLFMLGTASVLLVLGVLWMRKIVNIDV
jgi:tight adherence protein B